MTQLRPREGAFPPGRAGPGTVALGPALVRWTGRSDGDLADPTGDDPVVEVRRRTIVDLPWTWLVQVHGAEVATVLMPGEAAGEIADAAVSAQAGAALAVLTADCAPVALASPDGVIGVAHAGWRGLVAGVLEETVAAMRGLGAGPIIAALGPCVHAECYAFGATDLERVATRIGDEVRGQTTDGQPALDIPRAVSTTLARVGVTLAADAGICTACSPDHWSWRARGDRSRQATVVWRP